MFDPHDSSVQPRNRGVAVACFRHGSGPVVLLVHSSFTDHGQWRKLIGLLADRWRVVAPDRFGHGATPAWPDDALSFDGHAALLAEALGDERRPIHIVGHSFGAAAALSLALARPEEVATLTLFEPVRFHLLQHHADGAAAAAIAEWHDAFFAALAGAGNAAAARTFVDFWSGRGAWEGLKPEAREAMAPMVPTIAREWVAITADTVPPEAYRALSMPTLMLTGDSGPAGGRRPAEILARLMPNCRLQVIVGGGHLAPITHAEAVNGAILRQISAHRTD